MQEILLRLDRETLTEFASAGALAKDGLIYVWALVGSIDERRAMVALCEPVPGVTRYRRRNVPRIRAY